MLSRANERREGLLLNTDPYQDDRRLVCPPPPPPRSFSSRLDDTDV